METDFLVLGSGIAGLSFALKAARLGRVLIVTKSSIDEGATRYAQGGIAAVFSEKDSFESHIQDTLDAGDGLCNREIVSLTVREGPERVRELIALGVPFSRRDSRSADGSGKPVSARENQAEYDLTREGGHRERRILHADDFTGQAIESALVQAVRAEPNIRVLEHHVGIDLITNVSRARKRGGQPPNPAPERVRGLGAYVLDARKQEIHTVSSPFTVLATGGAGKVYLYTSNPDTATGDGIAMAARAGARVANMEFMQFHPTCFYVEGAGTAARLDPRAKSFLISEALRGEGGVLIDRSGRAFMAGYHPMGNLAPRDIVARAIDSEMKRTGAECVFLDMTGKDAAFLRRRFPNIHEYCLKFGVDLTRDPIPVVPAAHYTCGGVHTGATGESTVENLFAIGETACTGLHGANRLASNSLLEGVVFAHRAFECISERLGGNPELLHAKKARMPEPLPEWDSGMAVPMEERINIHHTWRELRTLMWNYVGIVRSNQRLARAQARLDLIRHEVQEYYWQYLLNSDLVELRNLVTVADLIVQSALERKESRGLHYNLDYPQRDDVFFKRETVL